MDTATEDDVVEGSLKVLREKRAAGARSPMVLSLPPLLPGDASRLLEALRSEGFTPGPSFRGGHLDLQGKGHLLSIEVSWAL